MAKSWKDWTDDELVIAADGPDSTAAVVESTRRTRSAVPYSKSDGSAYVPCGHPSTSRLPH